MANSVTYPIRIAVRVSYSGYTWRGKAFPGSTYERIIEGLHVDHALWRAQQEWPETKIEVLRIIEEPL